MSELLFHVPLSTGVSFLLILGLLTAIVFEFINGFHDTANAVATVIYTRSLSPWAAVVWSGVCNLTGVLLGGIAVAISIINLLPVDLLVNQTAGHALVTVFSLLLAAILWNFGTWYLGLPVSSSHTLIGAILGVGLANSALPGHAFGNGINWVKVMEVGMALLISPIIGFGLSGFLFMLSKVFIRRGDLFEVPKLRGRPPLWIRVLMVLTCTGVSLAHGSNDGQKGVGLIMLILIAVVPASYALNMRSTTGQIQQTVQASAYLENLLKQRGVGVGPIAVDELQQVRKTLLGKKNLAEVPAGERSVLRSHLLRAESELKGLQSAGVLTFDTETRAKFKKALSELRVMSDQAPFWVIFVIAISLGIGTMIGWKRVVVTVGEGIGKTHMNYAQGATAGLVAMGTIGLSAFAGLPVSTTHVLSSGIAGTMVAHRAGVQRATVQKIICAWILTLPAAMLISGVLFLLFRALV